MNVQILREAGYDEALLGLSLSYDQPVERMGAVAAKLAAHDSGENKFLESMIVWLDIVAPRNWWQQFGTYRVGVTKQSGSTMHTLLRRPLTQKDFATPLPDGWLPLLNSLIATRDLDRLKDYLPEGFLQRRILPA